MMKFLTNYVAIYSKKIIINRADIYTEVYIKYTGMLNLQVCFIGKYEYILLILK